MRNNTQNPRNIISNQPRENASNSKEQTKDSSQPNVRISQAPASAKQVSEEAIDVLSFVGFKL